MAHKKGLGASRNGRTSKPKYLGVKKYGGQFVTSGTIIVRQRGTPIHPGLNVKRAGDDSLFATAPGYVIFKRFGRKRKIVNVIPS